MQGGYAPGHIQRSQQHSPHIRLKAGGTMPLTQQSLCAGGLHRPRVALSRSPMLLPAQATDEAPC